MSPDESLLLSRRKVEYVKFIYAQNGPVKTSTIASAFHVDPSTITKTLADLTGSGYLSHVPYHGVCLTDKGRQCGEFLIKRHRLLSLVLVRSGLSEEQACSEVSRFESRVSKQAIDTMCRSLGHPRLSTCGEITHDDGCMAGDVQR